MIYSKFGDEVEIIRGDIETNKVDIRYKFDGRTMETYIYELKADKGINEIHDEIKRVMSTKSKRSKSTGVEIEFEGLNRDCARIDLYDKGAVLVTVKDGAVIIEAMNHITMEKEFFTLEINKS